MNRDLAFGAAGAAIAGGYYWLATAIPASALADAVGPQGLPKAYAVVLLALSLILVARSLRTANPRSPIPDPQPPTPDPRPPILDPRSPIPRVIGTLLIGVVYLLLVPWLGYVVALAGLLLVATWYQGGVLNRTIAAVAISGAIVFWLLFVQLLGIPHPAGIWPRLF